MSVTKIKFGDKEVETYTVNFNGEKWMVANPFAEALGYMNKKKAIQQHVSAKNQTNYSEIQGSQSGTLALSLHPQTKFINRAGVFELINASDMPGAKRFQAWNNNDLLPGLCQEGEYQMARDAPADIAHGMNAVHVATNEGVAAPWMKDFHEFKLMLSHKDELLAVKDKENEALTVALQNANHNLAVANQGLLKAFDVVNDARKETAEIAKRMADIAQDVIAKPSDPQLLHSLAVCSMGGDQYAFLRPQKRSLKRSLDRLSVDEKDIVYKSDYVPNSMNVLNKVKERLPKEKYKARHNRITLHEDLTREDLLQAIESTVSSRQVAIIVNKATNNSAINHS
ncbi:bro6 [Heliothis virescens ascovirus 3h]|uniref:Bro6 n=1 Tax=Heliothis virescens ascovirus 3h TaxID=1268039 RepID=A0A386JAC6_9VIRU|nr:bro6 [Heliothis virescens ascovirus 3h]